MNLRHALSAAIVAGAASFASVAGAPLESPAVSAAAKGLLLWIAGAVIGLKERVARIEGRQRIEDASQNGRAE